MLPWGRGYAYVSTGKERLWVPSKLTKISYHEGDPGYRQEENTAHIFNTGFVPTEVELLAVVRG